MLIAGIYPWSIKDCPALKLTVSKHYPFKESYQPPFSFSTLEYKPKKPRHLREAFDFKDKDKT